MSREIKFKGKRLDNKKWIYGSVRLEENRAYILEPCYSVIVNEPDAPALGCGVEDGGWQNNGYTAAEYGWQECIERYANMLPVWVEVDPETVSQFTGLHDSTKWEQLTEDEKNAFYVKNRSEDGKTVKYPTVEDVRHLWNGKEIYEGDIIYTVALSNDHHQRSATTVLTIKYFMGNPCLCCNGCETGVAIFPFCVDHILEVIGNIHDNPNLLK